MYLDDGEEFKYIGFKKIEKKENFFIELFSAINLLESKLDDEYSMEDNKTFLLNSIV